MGHPDRGEYLGDGYVPRLGPVRIFHNMVDSKRLVVMPIRYDGGDMSVARDRVSWRKSASKGKQTQG